MATTTEVRPEAAPRAEAAGHGPDRPVSGFELWTWLFMRISGLVLLILAVGHVLIMHVLDEGVDRRCVHPAPLGEPVLEDVDWLMLVLALLHGVNGLRVITLDYVRPAGARLAINRSSRCSAPR